jgi:hypothetical protein
MTVKELTDALSRYPADMRVVADLHSEYSEIISIETITGFENGGYVSRAYRATDKTRVHGWVYLKV